MIRIHVAYLRAQQAEDAIDRVDSLLSLLLSRGLSLLLAEFDIMLPGERDGISLLVEFDVLLLAGIDILLLLGERDGRSVNRALDQGGRQGEKHANESQREACANTNQRGVAETYPEFVRVLQTHDNAPDFLMAS